MHCFEQIWGVATYKTAALRPLTSHLTNYQSKTCWTSKDKFISNIPLWSPTSVGWQAKTYIHNSTQILDTVLRICQEQCSIGTNGEGESRESVLLAYLDSDVEKFYSRGGSNMSTIKERKKFKREMRSEIFNNIFSIFLL